MVTIPPKKTLGRNDPCHCGSGKKYKQCHLDKDEAAAREERAAAAAEALKNAPPEEAPAETGGKAKAQDRMTFHEQKGSRGANTKGFQRASAVRKVGGGG